MTLHVVSLRSLRLDLVIRMRNVGLWPWLVLAAWGLLARAQEPVMLRNFGIAIAPMAMWSGAAILLGAMALAGPRPPSPLLRHSAITAIALVLWVGLAQAAMSLVLDLVFFGPRSLGYAADSAVRFGLVWLPPVLAFVASPPTGGLAVRIVQGVPVLAALWMAAPIWRHGLAAGAAISGLACAGCLLACRAVSATSGTCVAAPALAESTRRA